MTTTVPEAIAALEKMHVPTGNAAVVLEKVAADELGSVVDCIQGTLFAGLRQAPDPGDLSDTAFMAWYVISSDGEKAVY